MHIVIFGLSISSSWGNGHATTFRSLVRGLDCLGHRVTFFECDKPWYADNRDATGFDYCELVLYSDHQDLWRHVKNIARADAVIVGSYVPDGPQLVDWLEGVVEGQLCFYDIDTPLTLDWLGEDSCEYLRADQVGIFDHYFSFAGGDALTRLAAMGARQPRPLYCSVDTDSYRPVEPTDARPPVWEIGYLGTYAEDRHPTVANLLLDVARERPDQRFVIAGPGYPDTDRWPENVDWLPHVPPARHREFYANQKFTLNATRAAMVAIGSSPSVRLFEAAACGSCIISDAWPGLEQVLTPDVEVLIAEDTSHVLNLVENLSARTCRSIRTAARQRAVAEHSHVRRAEYLAACLQDEYEVERAAYT